MTITLPVDEETDRLARRLAEVTGKSLPAIVRDAIAAEAARIGLATSKHASQDGLLAKMMAFTDGFADLPVLDRRTADEIVGYDDHGVAR